MALTTYSELQTSVANWLDRKDLSTYVVDFITLAEIRLNRELQIMPMQTRLRVTTVEDTPYLQLPSRFKGVKNVRVDGKKLDFVAAVTLDQSGQYVGEVADYTIEGDQLRFIKQLITGQVVELIVVQGFEPLSDTNTSNWWMANAPDLLLYASLLEAEPFLKNDSRLATWLGFFEKGVSALNTQDNQSRYGGNMAMRNEQ